MLLCQTFVKNRQKDIAEQLCVPLISRHTQRSALQFPLLLKTDHHKLTGRALKTESSKFSLTTEFLSLHAALLRYMSVECSCWQRSLLEETQQVYLSIFLSVV